LKRANEALEYLQEATDSSGPDGADLPEGFFATLAEAHATLSEEGREAGDLE
jgi:hypothetical protein